jgi:hypothetical protein
MTRGPFNLMRLSLSALLACVACAGAYGQDGKAGAEKRKGVSSVTIPVTLRVPASRERTEELLTLDFLSVFEDGERQEVLTIRGAANSPLTLAVLIQDDLASPAAGEIRAIADFIRGLPGGSRVMVGYLRAGSLQVRQRFTIDLERAAKSLRIPVGAASASPYNPFTLLRDAVKRFEGQPVGRRAVLMVSDGLDLSRGLSSSTPSQSVDLQRAIDESQRRGVAVYAIYTPSVGGGGGGGVTISGNGQSALNRLASETGGHAFFQGTGAPVSYQPFLRELNVLLPRQLAVTYLSTHQSKGFHRLRVESSMAEGNMRHPSGYVR